jgi:alpha-tubulin suppressor-like RCC1 family protein
MGLKRTRVIGSGWDHVLAAIRPTRTRRPEVWTWGLGMDGQLGIGPLLAVGPFEYYQVREPFPLVEDRVRHVRALSGGRAYSLALLRDGAVWAWGCNDNGQLGLGDLTTRWAPFQITSLPVAMAGISAGEAFSMALGQDGLVWTWGKNDQGQLGLGDTTPRMQPQLLAESAHVPIMALSGGDAFALALDRAGNVYAWGSGAEGQLGNAVAMTLRPIPVPGLPPIAAVAAGHRHALALARDGRVWSWGANERGQLGDGTTITRSIPRPVPSIFHATLIAAGGSHSLALSDQGEVWAWGDDTAGQLGFSTPPLGYVALPVKTKIGVFAVR